jgi:hypothetical protein
MMVSKGIEEPRGGGLDPRCGRDGQWGLIDFLGPVFGYGPEGGSRATGTDCSIGRVGRGGGW